MKNKKIIVGLILVLIIGIVGFIKIKSKGPSLRTVNAVEVKKEDMESRIKGTGTLVSKDKREVMSDVEEKIEKLYVKKGDKVKAGQILMKLEERDIQYKIKDAKLRLEMEKENLKKLEKDTDMDLKISLENLKIKLEDAKKEVERNTILHESGALNKVELEKSQDNLRQMENEMRLTEDKLMNSNTSNEIVIQNQRIELAKIELEKLNNELEKYVIKSPISGVIVETNISESGIIRSGTNLMSIQDIDNLELIMDMNENDAIRVKEGNEVDITGDSLQGKSYKGKVEQVGQIAKEVGNNKVIEVKVSIDSVSDDLKPGLTAKADILVASEKDVYQLPYEAIWTEKSGEKFIFIVEDNKINRIPIEIGIGNDFNIQVLGELDGVSQVILNPTEDMEIGEEVSVVGEI